MHQSPNEFVPYPPPIRKPKRWPWIIALVFVLLFGYAAGYAAGSHSSVSGASSEENPITGNTSPPTPTRSSFGGIVATSPTIIPTPSHAHVGQTIPDGDWSITLNAVHTSTGSEFDTPKPGNQFLLLDVTVDNLSSDPQTVSNLGMFTLRDLSGEEHLQSILTGDTTAPNGQADPGQPIKGTLAYEVPISLHAFVLSFLGHAGERQVSFDITV